MKQHDPKTINPKVNFYMKFVIIIWSVKSIILETDSIAIATQNALHNAMPENICKI